MGTSYYLVQLPLFALLIVVYIWTVVLSGILSLGFWRRILEQLKTRIKCFFVRPIANSVPIDFSKFDQDQLHTFRLHRSKSGVESAFVRGRPIYLTSSIESRDTSILVAFPLNEVFEFHCVQGHQVDNS